jgi:outer membrane lipoprotein LolB
MNLARRLAGGCAAAALALLAACAAVPKPTEPLDAVNGPWIGRMALQVEDKPSQSFSAGFELKGNAQTGSLTLYSPLGGTLASLAWQPGSATLDSGGEMHKFDSVEALIARVAGQPIPVAALFDWLRGLDTPVTGWQADLSQLADGRLAARRLEPPPLADLRVVLER